MWQLEHACKVQVLAQSTGQAIRQAPISAIEKTAALFDRESVALEWVWLLRTLDQKDPSEAVSEVNRRPKPSSGDSCCRGTDETLGRITHQYIVSTSAIVIPVLA